MHVNLRIAIIGCCLALVACATAVAADMPEDLEFHEWSVWIGEPQAKQMNAHLLHPSAMPGVVDTERSRRHEGDKPEPSPLSVLTAYGTPPEAADVDIRLTAGRWLAQWPKSEGKGNRLRWLDIALSKDLKDETRQAYVPETHWFRQARKLDTLYFNVKKGHRTERFLAYDAELNVPLPLRIDGEGDQYKVVNNGKHPLEDVLLIVPTPEGRRVGWVDKVGPGEGTPTPAGQAAAAPPAGGPQAVRMVRGGVAVAVAGGGAVVVQAAPGAAPAQPSNPGQPPNSAAPQQPAAKETSVDIPLSAPLKADGPEYRAATSETLQKKLQAAGLTAAEVELLLSLYAPHFFQTDEMVLLFRWPQSMLDESMPLNVEPDTARVKRVGLMLARKVDPKLRADMAELIKDLGNADYARREQAEEKLLKLGRLAVPELKKALKDMDPEVMTRAERLLLEQKEQLDAP